MAQSLPWRYPHTRPEDSSRRKPYEIIGVMPREFDFPLFPGQLNRCELWLPMSFTQAETLQGSAGNSA
jgi:hypothetical protein